MVEIEVPGEGRCQEKTGCYKKKKDMKIIDVKVEETGDVLCLFW